MNLPKIKKPLNSSRTRGFTLIELLLVIVIIGILAGVVIAVINPGRQTTRAKEGVASANLAKVCQALTACMSATGADTTKCDSWGEIGVNQPDEPAGWNWTVWDSAGSWASAMTSTGWSGGNDNTCEMRCLIYASFGDWAGHNPGAVVKDSDCTDSNYSGETY